MKGAIRIAEKTGQLALTVYRDFGGQLAKPGSAAEPEQPKKSLGATPRKSATKAKFQAIAKFAGAARRLSVSSAAASLQTQDAGAAALRPSPGATRRSLPLGKPEQTTIHSPE